MIDIEYLIKNRLDYEKSISDRNLKPGDLKLDELIELYRKKKSLQAEIDDLRAQRNKINAKIKNNLKDKKQSEFILKSKELKNKLQQLEKNLIETEKSFKERLLLLPNIASPKMPRGKDSNDNVVLKEWGKKPQFNFSVKDHIQLGQLNDLIDLEASAKVAGSRFYYLKNDLVLMQFALFSFVLKKLIAKGLTPLIPPVIVKRRALEGTGYLPFEADNIYRLEIGESGFKENEDREPKFLVGTSEVSIVSYHQDTIFEKETLPKKYVGYSPCFRTEVGSWGKDVKGIKRVHQFDKIEIIYFTSAETSEKLMLEVLDMEEEILQDLGLPYRVLDMCSGDVGMPTYRKFDLEVWLPSQKSYMEVMSNSDLWEFQARRLNIRYKENGKNKFCHTISATAITNTRPLLAIMENYQQEDGSILVPEVLREYIGKKYIGKASYNK